MFCHKCGSKSTEDAEFCYKCGTGLVIETAAQPSEVPVPEVVEQPMAQMPVLDQEAPLSIAEQNPAEPERPQTIVKPSAPSEGQGSIVERGFKDYVDEYVKTNTEFASADELLSRAKPLVFAWITIGTGTLAGFVIGLVAGGDLGIIAAAIGAFVGVILGTIVAAYIGKFRSRKFKKVHGFSGKVDVDHFVMYLNSHMSMFSDQFGQWENMQAEGNTKLSKHLKRLQKKVSKVSKAVEKTLHLGEDGMDVESVRCRFCKKIYAEITFIYKKDMEPTYQFSATRRESVFTFILDLLAENDTNTGLGEYRCLFMSAPILTAAIDFYLNHYSKTVVEVTETGHSQPAAAVALQQKEDLNVTYEDTDNVPTTNQPYEVIAAKPQKKRKVWLIAAIPACLIVIAAVVVIIIFASGDGQGNDSSGSIHGQGLNTVVPTQPPPSPATQSPSPTPQAAQLPSPTPPAAQSPSPTPPPQVRLTVSEELYQVTQEPFAYLDIYIYWDNGTTTEFYKEGYTGESEWTMYSRTGTLSTVYPSFSLSGTTLEIRFPTTTRVYYVYDNYRGIFGDEGFQWDFAYSW